MTRLVILGIVVLSMAACGRVSSGLGRIGLGSGAVERTSVEVEGQRFKARANPDREDPRNFSVTVTPVAVNPEGAMDSARYQATRYCLLTYGGSDTDWVLGPDTPLTELSIADDTATLSGRCTQR